MEENFSFYNETSNGSYNNISAFQQYYYASSGNKAVGLFFQKYVLPIIVFIGLVGNSLSSSTFLGKELRKISSSVYVISVLFADTGVLSSLVFVWLEVLRIRINSEDGICQFLVYWSYVCSFLSVWFVVCITVENYITICHPTKIKTMCTLRRANIVTASLTVFAFTAYLPSIFSVEVVSVSVNGKHYRMCVPSPSNKNIVHFVAYADSVVTLIIPLVLIFFMLLAISLAILRSMQQKRRRSVATNLNEKQRFKNIPQLRVAKMLYVLSVTFFILNVPSHATRIYILFGLSSSTWTGSEEQAIIQLLLQFIYYTNFAIKFFLFVSCSKNFRKILVKQFCRKRQQYKSVNRSDTETKTTSL
ncbi:hypothetical protein FSP39_002712 [Pinctada imbricata]|uniref:G-protein coupled receptors family 1 profile domain-containing protein n=1 Tax=Pinctada imbricata TaxID=66713 RepID=A0AA88XYW4_PINIB|nr:hypothetical protein FSP39_002712 [Pinctada imbricata]